MKRFLVSHLPEPGSSVFLSQEETHHAKNVLRLGSGTSIELLDGQGRRIQGILRLKGNRAQVQNDGHRLGEKIPKEEQVLPLRLEIAVLKSDAMKWIIEKAVELGVEELQPIFSRNVTVRHKQKERISTKWQVLADQTLKQCGRLYRMPVRSPIRFQEVFDLPQSAPRIIADEGTLEQTKRENLADLLQSDPQYGALLIGPEGGWAADEKHFIDQQVAQNQARSVCLSPLLLKAETAAFLSISQFHAQWMTKRVKTNTKETG